jgi:hypothetical protein
VNGYNDATISIGGERFGLKQWSVTFKETARDASEVELLGGKYTFDFEVRVDDSALRDLFRAVRGRRARKVLRRLRVAHSRWMGSHKRWTAEARYAAAYGTSVAYVDKPRPFGAEAR